MSSRGADMTILMSQNARRNRQADASDADRHEAGAEAEALRREMPLVPAASIAGRALVTVIAIMTFLASLSAGTAILITQASRGWQSQVSQEATIQVRPVPGHDLDAEAKKAADIAARNPGVGDVRMFSAAESARLLEPWLGGGLDLGELPVPRMIVVKKSDSAFDADALRKSLAKDVPSAIFDDHSMWLSRLTVMTRTVVGASIILFGLVLTAMLLAVAFATRGAMAGNREIIDVLHFVGAEDRFIARVPAALPAAGLTRRSHRRRRRGAHLFRARLGDAVLDSDGERRPDRRFVRRLRARFARLFRDCGDLHRHRAFDGPDFADDRVPAFAGAGVSCSGGSIVINHL